VKGRRPHNAIPLVAALLLAAAARADLASVHLTDGTTMRGDVSFAELDVVLRNLAGEVRLPRDTVRRIEWLTPASTPEAEFQRRFYALRADDVDGHFALAEYLWEQGWADLSERQCRYVLGLDPQHAGAARLLQQALERGLPAESQPASQPAAEPQPAEVEEPPPGAEERIKGPALPALLSPRDINLLRLYEYRLDGAPERVQVRFTRRRGEPELETLVKQELASAGPVDPRQKDLLDRGTAHEKLVLILSETGTKFADRIELRGDTDVFATFRRDVLPIVVKGCARSGCHGGREAYGFRFPIGASTNEAVAYTSFLILDQLDTPAGRMIDRADPESSALLRYMLPADEGGVHPPLKRGVLRPVLRSGQDRAYEEIVDWIRSLRAPHPEYALEFRPPAWLGAGAELTSQPAAQPAGETERGASQGSPPASRPAGPPRREP